MKFAVSLTCAQVAASLQHQDFLPAAHVVRSEPSAPGMQKTNPPLMQVPHPRFSLNSMTKSSSYFLGAALLPPTLVASYKSLRNDSLAEATPARVIIRIEVTMFLI